MAPVGTAIAGSSPVPDQVRVVVVDDSAVVRRVVGEVIRRAAGVTLAGTAADGRQALTVIEQARPHVVVLDVEMPGLDGLAALGEVRKRWPKLPVVMFSTLTERGAATTLEALAEGADDYLAKPVSHSGPAGTFDAVRADLVPLLRAWGAIGQTREGCHRPRSQGVARDGAEGRGGGAGPGRDLSPARTGPPARVRPPLLANPGKPVPVAAIVIGTSTGGPNALGQVVPSLPVSLGVPVLVVQHMPPTFTRLLAERLAAQSKLLVHEASAGMVAQPGHVYVAPGGSHMVVSRAGPQIVVRVDDGPPENSCKPSVDVLFRSAAAVWGAGVLAVVLTGMGQDGLLGAQAVVAAGGSLVAQDEATSVVWGMPGAVVRAGLAADVVGIGEVAGTIVRRAGRGPSGRGAGSARAVTATPRSSGGRP